MRSLLLTTILSLSVSPAFADDAALLLGIERYRELGRVVQGADVTQSARALTDLGFITRAQANGSSQSIAQKISRYVSDVSSAERTIVVLSGRFVTDGSRTWYLPTEAPEPQLFNLSNAVSVESILAVMASLQGQAVLMLGVDISDTTAFDSYLHEGIGDLEVPHGVTIFQGRPRALSDVLTEATAEPGADFIAIARENGRISVSGFAPDSLVLVAQAPDDTALPDVNYDVAAEAALWNGSRALDSEAGYVNYLRRFPNGPHLDEAQTLLTEIRSEPNRGERLAEDALSLSRDARRDIQRDLTILNYNTRGIDGIFGSGTRSAIANWQQENGYSQSSYFTTEQINRLDAQASRRAAELEAQAERARAAQLRLDREYWAETGSREDEAGYRAYLERYPDGTFAQRATSGLEVIATDKRQLAAAEDRNAWDRAQSTDTAAGYRNYLQTNASGTFVAEAQAKLDALAQTDENADAILEARAIEDQLELTPITIRLIEARLGALGLEPGDIDGRINRETRRALRRYQRGRSLEVSGHVNEETIVRLLADTGN